MGNHFFYYIPHKGGGHTAVRLRLWGTMGSPKIEIFLCIFIECIK